MKIQRLSLPPPGQRVRGWCPDRNDRWDGECPQQEDEPGFLVYADEESAYAALACGLAGPVPPQPFRQIFLAKG